MMTASRFGSVVARPAIPLGRPVHSLPLPCPRHASINAFELQRRELASFPAALRALIDAELSAGNEIAGIGHRFPAPASGAFVMLARPVSSRPPQASDGLLYRERSCPMYSGEFTDSKEQYFVLTARSAPERSVPGETPKVTAPKAAPQPAHTVEVDPRAELLIYREPNRATDVTCTFRGRPRIQARTLSGWWYPSEQRAEKMSRAEEVEVLRRMVEYCRINHGMQDLLIEGWP